MYTLIDLIDGYKYDISIKEWILLSVEEKKLYKLYDEYLHMT